MRGFIKRIMGVCVSMGIALFSPVAGAVDNTALQQKTFREHTATYGLVYLMSREAAPILFNEIHPRLRQRLLKLGLRDEANTFNLAHVTVVHIHSTDPGTPEKMLQALPGNPSVLNVKLKDFSVTFAAKGAEVPWWFDLGVVKQGQGYKEMMSYNTLASAALTPLRDGPLPRCTGPVFARMSDAAKDLVAGYGVSGINVIQDGKETAAHNPHNTLVYSMTPLDAVTEGALKAFASELNAAVPDGIDTQFTDMSIVEIGFMGNVLREFYRINLGNGEVREASTGKRIVR